MTSNSLIKRALYQAAIIEANRIDALHTIDKNITEHFKSKEEKIINECKKIERSVMYSIKCRRIVLIAAILTTLLLSIVACATIEPIRNYIMEITGISTTFKSNPGEEQDDGSNENSQDTYEAGLNYVPTGFVIDDSWQINDSNWFECMYRKEETRITYSKMTIASTSSSFDSEGTPTKILNIDGKEVFLFTKWKTDQAVWHDEVYRYVIAYPEELDFSEVEKMIKSAR